MSDRIEAIENEKSAILDTMKLHNDEMKKIQKSGALASGETTAQSKEQQKVALMNEHERLKQKDAENDEKITQEGRFYGTCVLSTSFCKISLGCNLGLA